MSDNPPPKPVQGGLLSGLLDDLAPRQISMGDIGDDNLKQNKEKVKLKTHAQKVSGLKKQFLKLPVLSLFTLKQVFKVWCTRSSNGRSASDVIVNYRCFIESAFEERSMDIHHRYYPLQFNKYAHSVYA